jgi:ATP-binding cassette subfamily B protein
VVARGTHAVLLEQSPVYAEIFASQLIPDAPAAESEAQPEAVIARP